MKVYCMHCGDRFEQRQAWQKYCSHRCASAHLTHGRRDHAIERATQVLVGAPVEISQQLSLGGVEKHRQIDCENYDECLDYAAAQEWSGFSCETCPSYKPISADAKRAWTVELLRQQSNLCDAEEIEAPGKYFGSSELRELINVAARRLGVCRPAIQSRAQRKAAL